MTPLDEARSGVSDFFREVIRSHIYRNVRLNGAGLEDMDSELDAKAEYLFERAIGAIEEQYKVSQSAVNPDDGFAHACLYYSIFSATLVSFIIGSNVR